MTKEQAYGNLTIKAFVAEEAVPIKGVSLLIKGDDGENSDVIFTSVTDENGLSEQIILPTLPKELSLSPEKGKGYYSYNVTATREGYINKSYHGIPIFSGVNTYLPINMIPEDNEMTAINSDFVITKADN